MKILFVSRHYFPFMGGIEQNIFKVTSHLKESHEVEILTVQENDLSSSEVIDGISVFRISPINFISFDLSKYNIIFLENFNLSPHIFFILNVIKDKYIKNKNYSIYFVPHGGFTPYWKTFSFISRMIKKAIHKLIGLPFINNYVTKVIAVSNWEMQVLFATGITAPLCVIGNGYENIGEKMIKNNSFVFVGRIDPIKNIEKIISVFAEIILMPQYSDHVLNIIGKYSEVDPYFKKLKLITKELGIEKSVVFLGRKDGVEKMNYISPAKALFCLSHFETDPIVVKEALSVETKVIAESNFGLKEYKNNLNIYFLQDIPSKEVPGILNFIEDPFVDIKLLNSWRDVSLEYEKIIGGTKN